MELGSIPIFGAAAAARPGRSRGQKRNKRSGVPAGGSPQAGVGVGAAMLGSAPGDACAQEPCEPANVNTLAAGLGLAHPWALRPGGFGGIHANDDAQVGEGEHAGGGGGGGGGGAGKFCSPSSHLGFQPVPLGDLGPKGRGVSELHSASFSQLHLLFGLAHIAHDLG